MEQYLLISDAAKEVEVEAHVLRYWEVELQLPIQRNEQGHRYYTLEDIERFKQIKEMKEKGMQLKAIKVMLKDGEIAVISDKQETSETSGENKAQKLQWMLRQLIGDVVRENNQELLQELRENMVKELDYQFRCMDEKEEERERKRVLREEEHYRILDEILRKKAKKKRRFL